MAEGSIQAASPVEEQRGPGARGERAWVHAQSAACVLPDFCAGCGGDAQHSQRVEIRRRGQGAGEPEREAWIIPLCEVCFTRTEQRENRGLSFGFSALVIALSLALGGPLIWERQQRDANEQAGFAASGFEISALGWFFQWGLFLLPGLVVSLGGLSYFLLEKFYYRRRAPGGSSPPVWVEAAAQGGSFIGCAELGFAARLVELNPELCTPAVLPELALLRLNGRARRRVFLREYRFLGLALALSIFLGGILHWVHRPRVHLLNLSEQMLEFEVDGERVAQLFPTSQESPLGGKELRLAAGRRLFRVLAAGEEVARAEVTLLGGVRHLYAPLSEAHCFWLERVQYGRQAAADAQASKQAPAISVRRIGLDNSLRFWAFIRPVDIWLAPPPTPIVNQSRLSGGQVVALRQARCLDAPPELQSQP